MTERKVSLRVSAVGGEKLKAELRSIGKEGQHALSLLETGGPGASRGLHATGLAAEELMGRLTRLSMQAAQAANSMKVMETSGSSMLARVNAATGVSGGVAREAADIAAYGQALDAARAKWNPMFAVIQKYRAELAQVKHDHAVGAISADEMTAAISRLRQASLHEIDVIKGRVQGYEQMAKQGGLARFQMVQLGYQLNDIGVSLASGQNPLIVMIQQGAQIAQIYGGQGGVREMFRQIGSLITGLPGPLKAFAIAAGAAALSIKGIQAEILETTDVAVSFGDTALAVWQVVSEGIYSYIKPAIDFIGPYIQAAWDGIIAGVHTVGNAIINGFKLAFLTVETIFKTLPAVVGGAVIGAANAVLTAIETLVTKAMSMLQGMLDSVASLIQKVPGMEDFSFGSIGAPPPLPKIPNPFVGELEAAWGEFEGQYNDILASDPLGEFFSSIRARAIDNAKKRLAEEGKKGGGGAGGKEKKADEELGFLDKIMKALDDYAKAAMDFGQQIGDAMVNAFKSAEDALVEFVETGKFDIKSLVTSIISDFARIGIRGYIMGPLAQALGGAIGGPVGDMLIKAFVQHTGGPAGSGSVRSISAANFVTAPRLHSGMGGLRADEFATILQRGERVLNRRETQDYEAGRFGQPMVVNFNGVRDAQVFRQSRTQIAADLSRAVSMGARGR